MDLNGDGILDVTSGDYSTGVWWFRGTEDGFAKRELIEEDHGDKKPMMHTAHFLDWDDDGDYDMLIGDVKGRVSINLNTGTKRKFEFGKRVPVRAGDGELEVVQKSDALPVDWDGDGVIDLLVGDEAADVNFFKGRGDGSFEQGVSLWTGQKVDPKLGYRDTKQRIAGKARVPGYRLRLWATDWNEDGKLDLLVGNCESKEQKTAAGKASRQTIGNVYLFLAVDSSSDQRGG